MTVGRILVLDPDSPTAVCTVRALGSVGWQVGVGSDSGTTAACASKWCSFQHDIPMPQRGLEPFVDAINRAVDARGYELVFGCGDDQVFALSNCREAIRAGVPYSADAAVRRAFDKLSLTEIAEIVDLAVPNTFPANVPDAAQLKPPVIVKARWHWSSDGGAEARHPVSICQSMEDAFAMADQVKARGAEPIIQEFHEGCLMSFNIVTGKSFQPLAVSQHKAHAIWPLKVGTPARAVTMEVDRKLAKGVSRLLERLGWFGLVNLQFIVPEDGIPRLIDFNGRPYQTLSLALGAGVNFMDIWARAATDRELRLPEQAKVGVRYHDLFQDLSRINSTYGLRPQELFKCFRFALGATHIVWALNDPKPAIYRYRQIALLARRMFQGGKGN